MTQESGVQLPYDLMEQLIRLDNKLRPIPTNELIGWASIIMQKRQLSTDSHSFSRDISNILSLSDGVSPVTPEQEVARKVVLEAGAMITTIANNSARASISSMFNDTSRSTFTFPEIADDRDSRSPSPASTSCEDADELSRINRPLIESMEHLMNHQIGSLNDSEILLIAEAYDFPTPDLSRNQVQFRNYNKVVSFYRSSSTGMVQPTDDAFPTEKKCKLRTFTIILEQVIRCYSPPDRKVFYVPQVKRSRDSSTSDSSPKQKRKRSNTPVKERLGNRSNRDSSRNKSRNSDSSRKIARRRRSRSTFGRSPSVTRTSRHPRFRSSRAFNDCYKALRPRRSFSRVADKSDPPLSRRRLASSKTSTPLEKKEVFEYEKKKTDDSGDDSDVQEIPVEKPVVKNSSKADKKKKLAEKTRSFKEYLEKSVEREVIFNQFLHTSKENAAIFMLNVICDCLGIKKEPSWTLVMMYELILSKVSASMTISMIGSHLCTPESQLLLFVLFLTLYFQADNLQQNQHKRWLLVNSNICAYADILLV